MRHGHYRYRNTSNTPHPLPPPTNRQTSPTGVSTGVVRMQALVRGHSARKIYDGMMYDKYLAEEEREREAERARLEEGMRLLERKDTERAMLEKAMLEEHARKAAALHAPPPPIPE